MADTATKAHKAHAAAQHDPAGSARTFLGEAALPVVRALNGAGAPTLLPAMHQIVNAVRPGLIGPEAALYGYWITWRRSNRSGRPLSMGDTLRLRGRGSATSLHSSAPALLHTLRTRCPRNAAPYLIQARTTYPGRVSELEAKLHLLHPPDEDLEVGEVTIFVEDVGETPTRPRPTNPVYNGTRPTPPYTVVCEAFPREPTWCPALRPATHAPRPWADPRLSPPPLQDQGCPAQRAGHLARASGYPPAPPRRHDPWGPGAGPGGHPHPRLRGSARVRPPLPVSEARDGLHAFLQTQEVTPVMGVDLVRLPPAAPDYPPGPRALSPTPDWEVWRDVWAALLARLPPQCRWMTIKPLPAWNQHHRQPPPPLPPSPPRSTTRHCPRHATDAQRGSGTDTPTTTSAYQGNSDVELQWLPPAGRPPPQPVPLPHYRLTGILGGDSRGARGAGAGGGRGASRAAGRAAPCGPRQP